MADDACRYCGILPDQELPRPSFQDLRSMLSDALEALDIIATEPTVEGEHVMARIVARSIRARLSEADGTRNGRPS